MMKNRLVNSSERPIELAGHVIETQRDAGYDDCQADALIYLPFRDGVTVKLGGDLVDRLQATFADQRSARISGNYNLRLQTTRGLQQPLCWTSPGNNN
ncbi:hypothetical protein [Agrobacterium sp. El2ro-1b]|uniref:hypothetical protein n=1 Tax=Agrobacterium sp. El2ro-1b TaxID=2969528 RepID=UPI003AB0A441